MKKKYYEVIQEENGDCGITCLSSIIKYYGGYVPLETLRMYTNTNELGTNAYEIVNCAKKLGFNSCGKVVDTLDKVSLPLIAHLKLENEFYHFVVVYEIKRDSIIVMDPAMGLKRMEYSEFYKLFTGNILLFNPINVIPRLDSNKYLKDKIINYIRDNKRFFLIVFLINMFILLISLLENFEIKILQHNINYIYILIFVLVFEQVLIYLKNKIMLNGSINFNNEIIECLIVHIFKLPLNYLKLKQKGEITTRFTELNELTNNILNYIMEIIFNFMLVIIVYLIILKLTIKLSLVLLLLTLFYILLNLKIYKKLVNMITYSMNMEESYNSNIIDYITKFETIKHLNNYKYFIKNIKNNLKRRNDITKNINNKVYFVNMLNSIIFNLFILFVLAFLLKNNFNLINSLLIFMLVNFYIDNIKKIMDYYPSFILFNKIIRKNNDFLSVEIINREKTLESNFDISIKNLFYSLNNKVILSNLNYDIFYRDKVFIKGPSGIGKSTLLKILNNEIVNYQGIVRLNNKDLKVLEVTDFITYTSQDEELFNDTILNNLTIGLDVDEKLLNDVIRICKINDINVVKNVGLDSFIVNNNSFSGGEKNRIILARSLIHSKEIIILDEVLKEVDYNLEIDIVKNILSYFSDRTVIYVSHKNIDYLFPKVLVFRKE